MQYSKTKIQSYGKIFGGKNRYSRQYIKLLNASGITTLVEPYSAGAGITMNVPPAAFVRTILNDIDPNICRVLTTLRDRGELVAGYLQQYNYTKENFDQSAQYIGSMNRIVHTINYIIRNRMSSGGMFKRFGESVGKKILPESERKVRLRGGQMGDANAFYEYVHKHIYGTIARLQNVEIFNKNALDLIRLLSSQKNSDEIMYILDPPYLTSGRVSKNVYLHEITEQHHVELLDLITSVPGRMYICGYFSDLYHQKLVVENGWHCVQFDRAADSGCTEIKSRRVEHFWSNTEFCS